MISLTIKNALSITFNMSVEYFSMVQHNQNQYFIIIGSTSILLLSDSFDKLEAKIAFQCIDRLIVSSKDIYLFQIHLNTKRPANVPAKMNLHCLERRSLVKYIRFGWKTDYMYKFLEVRELPTYKAEFRDYAYRIEMLQSPQSILLEYQEIQKFNMFTIQKYSFFLPSIYSNNKKGVYTCSKFKSEFNIQVSDSLPLEVLNFVGDRKELQYYAETYMQSLCMQKDYWILDSSIYYKRRNLYYDVSEWSGWQMSARTAERDVILIILRRKYHPPLLENFVDFVLTFFGPPGFKNMQEVREGDDEDEEGEEEEEEQAEEDQEEEDEDGEGQKKHAAEDYKKAVQQIYDEQYVQNLVREAADTIFYSELVPLDPCYRSLLQHMANNLMYDEEQMKYMNQNHGIISQYSKNCLEILTIIKDMLNKGDLPQERLPNAYIKNFLDSLEYIDDGKRVFAYKFSRFLAYCLDGGLQPDFNFQYFIDKLMSSQQHYKSDISKLIDFCLFPVSESTGTMTDFIVEENFKKLSKIVQQRYVYNERVMNSLLETNVFRDELLKKETSQQIYVDLLIHLLLNSKTCKSYVCKHIINYQVQCKDQINEQIVNLLKGLISPLLIVYQSDFAKLSTLAAVALYNMCANSKEFKYAVMKENGLNIINSKINTKYQNLLHYTLRLVYSLMAIVQNIEAFLTLGLDQQIFSILKGSPDGIMGAFYSAQVETICLRIITRCISKENSYRTRLETIIDIVVRDSDIYFENQVIIDQLKAEGLNTIFRICSLNEKDENIFQLLQQELVPYLLDLVKYKLDIVLQVGLLKILCLMVKNYPDMAQEWEKEKFITHIEKMEQEGIQGADYLMSKLSG